jgi:uncharacterized protein
MFISFGGKGLVERTADVHFHGDLKDFLRGDNREGHVAYPVNRRASIKDVIEALGVPHSEVGRIVVDGAEAGFGHLLGPGERVHVEPHRIPIRVDVPTILRPRPLAEVRFVVDVNVGKLASLLRLLGYDTAYEHAMKDEALAALARDQGRIVLTRDRDLLRRSIVEHGRMLRTQVPMEQLAEVVRVFGLTGPFALFSRCLRCNDPLRPVAKENVLHRLEPRTRRYYRRFHVCPRCDRIYWRGSHHKRMVEELERVGISGKERATDRSFDDLLAGKT